MVKKYEQIYGDLLARIESGAFRDGKLPTEAELVAGYGVSRTTARHALMQLAENGKIWRKPHLGTFVNDSAGKNKTIAVLIINERVNNSRFLDAVMNEDERFGFLINVFMSELNVEYERQVIDSVGGGQYCGLIYLPSTDDSNIGALAALRDKHVPIVLVDLPILGLDLPVVTTDNAAGVYALAEHYIKQGCRRFAFGGLHAYRNYCETERFCGFCRAMTKHGLPIREEYLFRSDSIGREYFFMSVEEQNAEQRRMSEAFLQQWCSLSEKPEVLMMSNDRSAIDFLECAAEHGVDVSSQTIVTGFDNLDESAEWGIPTIAQNFYGIGVAALSMIDKLMQGIPCKGIRTIASHPIIRDGKPKNRN